MIRTQISLTEEQMRRAKIVADRRGISLAALVREALDHHLGDAEEQRRRDAAREAVGGFHSGDPRLAVEHDRALGESDAW